jgi:Uma2 family endonuclease
MAHVTIDERSPQTTPAGNASGVPLGRVAIPPRYRNLAEFVQALGDVSSSRILFDPWPGTATEEDLVRLTDGEDRPCELIHGILIEKVGTNYQAMLGAALSTILLNYVMPERLGIVTGATVPVRLRPGLVRMPDLAYFSMTKFPGRRIPRESISGVLPDLAIEFADERNTDAEMRLKLQEYFLAGVSLVWVIDVRAETIAIHRSTKGPSRVLNIDDRLDGEAIVPGFSIPLEDLFHSYPEEMRVG